MAEITGDQASHVRPLSFGPCVAWCVICQTMLLRDQTFEPLWLPASLSLLENPTLVQGEDLTGLEEVWGSSLGLFQKWLFSYFYRKNSYSFLQIRYRKCYIDKYFLLFKYHILLRFSKEVGPYLTNHITVFSFLFSY